jgi:hypothetical protein
LVVSVSNATEVLHLAQRGVYEPIIHVIQTLAWSLDGHPWEKMFFYYHPLLTRKIVSCLQKSREHVPPELGPLMVKCLRATLRVCKHYFRSQIEITGEKGTSIFVDKLLFKLIMPPLPITECFWSLGSGGRKGSNTFTTGFLSQKALEALKVYIEEGCIPSTASFDEMVQLYGFGRLVNGLFLDSQMYIDICCRVTVQSPRKLGD